MSFSSIDVDKVLAEAFALVKESLGAEATDIDAARAMHWRQAESFEQKWRASGNPIWVWRALARLAYLCSALRPSIPQLAGRHFVDDVPSWCVEYLVRAAFRVERLAAGYDFRADEAGPRFHVVDGPLSPSAAANRLPGALEFVRGGKSAFAEYRAEDTFRLLVEAHEVAPDAVTFEDMMRIMGWEDERNARRKLARVKGRAKPRG